MITLKESILGSMGMGDAAYIKEIYPLMVFRTLAQVLDGRRGENWKITQVIEKYRKNIAKRNGYGLDFDCVSIKFEFPDAVSQGVKQDSLKRKSITNTLARKQPLLEPYVFDNDIQAYDKTDDMRWEIMYNFLTVPEYKGKEGFKDKYTHNVFFYTRQDFFDKYRKEFEQIINKMK